LEDTERFIKTFLLDSWLTHLGQHERISNAERILQDAVRRYHASGTSKVSRLIVADLLPRFCLCVLL
jgi:Transmembrane secretion effector